MPTDALEVVRDIRAALTRADPEWRDDFFATISPCGAERLLIRVEREDGSIRTVVLACHPEIVPDDPPEPGLFC